MQQFVNRGLPARRMAWRWVRGPANALTGCALLLSSILAMFSPVEAAATVLVQGEHLIGTIIVNTSERRLRDMLGHVMAPGYAGAVNKQGMPWSGETMEPSKRRQAGLTRASGMRREHPDLPAFVPPGPKNPLGVRAIDAGASECRIPATTIPGMSGRIGMRNAEAMDLFERVHTDAPV